jgi:hypothetical protein
MVSAKTFDFCELFGFVNLWLSRQRSKREQRRDASRFAMITSDDPQTAAST